MPHEGQTSAPADGWPLEPDAPTPASAGRPVGVEAPSVPDDVAGPTQRDPLVEAVRLIGLAEASGLQVRLLGGLAFHARCPEWTARIERERRDIDLAIRSRDRKAFGQLLEASGYAADRQYNALYGHKQLYFVDIARGRPVDVLVDRMEMCHTFEFAGRLDLDGPTLPLAELLLSKLQIARINRKDILDALALLSEYPLAAADESAINLGQITRLTGADWGWWRTVTGNLDKLRLFIETELQPGELEFRRPARFNARAQIVALRGAIDGTRKSARWKLRSQVGDRVQWFQEPEEVGHGR
jgi:hypothetical protein